MVLARSASLLDGRRSRPTARSHRSGQRARDAARPAQHPDRAQSGQPSTSHQPRRDPRQPPAPRPNPGGSPAHGAGWAGDPPPRRPAPGAAPTTTARAPGRREPCARRRHQHDIVADRFPVNPARPWPQLGSQAAELVRAAQSPEGTDRPRAAGLAARPSPERVFRVSNTGKLSPKRRRRAARSPVPGFPRLRVLGKYFRWGTTRVDPDAHGDFTDAISRRPMSLLYGDVDINRDVNKAAWTIAHQLVAVHDQHRPPPPPPARPTHCEHGKSFTEPCGECGD